MDLEQRTRDLFAAIGSGPAQAILVFLAADAVFEVPGLLPPIGLAKLDPMLHRAYATVPPIQIEIQAMKMKRNVIFAGCTARGQIPGGGPGEMEGLAIINWDRTGKVSRLEVHLGADAAARLGP